MNRQPTCPISIVQEATGARKEAIVNAARISGIRVLGNLLAGDVSKFKLDFFITVEDEEAMLSAAEQRRNNRNAKGAHP